METSLSQGAKNYLRSNPEIARAILNPEYNVDVTGEWKKFQVFGDRNMGGKLDKLHNDYAILEQVDIQNRQAIWTVNQDAFDWLRDNRDLFE